jgi:hypothetical protein
MKTTTIASITSVTAFQKSTFQVIVTTGYRMKITQLVSLEPVLEQNAFDALLS